jgi:CRISPR/Cas system CMR subunit Cmr6 (Cas7 group RAMP superfamily)
MSYEFLADMALTSEEASIEQVVKKQGRYANLPEKSWTTRSRILATGLAHDDEFVSVLKNGRERLDKKRNLPARQGYPSIIKNSENNLDSIWKELLLPSVSQLSLLPAGSCFLQFNLKLERPFFSKDDLAFYPHENPLKREHILGTPYLSAAGVKGLLRWAWQMCWGGNKSDAEMNIFGPRHENLDDNNGKQGSLYPYPLFWNGKIGLDVINPHDRKTGTGTNPIKYEVVDIGGVASLFIMFVNRMEDWKFINTFLDLIKEPLQLLLEGSGLSAKRSAGWGAVKVTSCSASLKVSPKTGNGDPNNGTQDYGDLTLLADRTIFSHHQIASILEKDIKWVKKNRSKAEGMVREKLEPSNSNIITIRNDKGELNDLFEKFINNVCEQASDPSMMEKNNP